MSGWIAGLRAALTDEGRAVVVTVAATRGSVPREAGARMIVTGLKIYGTIGGGHLEFEAIRIARETLAQESRGAWLARFPLAARLGQCCGGVATVLFQDFDRGAIGWLEAVDHRVRNGDAFALATAVTPDARSPALVPSDTNVPAAVVAALETLLREEREPQLVEYAGRSWFIERATSDDFRIVVFGNGHVGRALVQVLGALPCSVTWVDEREGDFPANVPSNVAIVATDVPEAEVRVAAPASMFLVMTHRHALDFDLVATIVARGDAAYVGMIGSAAKRAQMERRLRERGFDAAAAESVVCPIGVAGISSREPGAIAVAVAAQLLQQRERAAAARNTDRPRVAKGTG